MADPPSPPQPPDDRTSPHLALRAAAVWFDRFELRQILGRGGMGVVWSAWDRRLEEWVALKFLPEVLRWDAAALAALRQETQRARRLSHPNIVRVYDLHECEDGIALAMELIEGETLTDWRMRQPGGVVEPADIEPWLPGLCSALDYAHQEAGIVHRDIKPANLLLTREGQIRITDFSIASLIPGTMARVSTVTQGGTLVYMSPQQLWGEPAGPADDIYSLGVTLYELLCGQPPFTHGDISRQIETRAPTAPNKHRQHLDPPREPLPARWESLVLSCLAKHPAQRPSSAGELLERLDAGHSSLRRSTAIWRSKIMVAVCVVLLLGTAGLYFHQANIPLSPTAAPAPLGNGGLETSRAASYIFGSMAKGLLAHYPFDSSTQDYCSGGFDAAGQNVTFVPDRFGMPNQAVHLAGNSNLRMTLGAITGPDREFTIAGWFKPPRFTAIIWRLTSDQDHYQGIELHRRGGALNLRIIYPDSALTSEVSTAPINDLEEWHHLTTVISGTMARLYLDGKLAAETNLPAPPIHENTSYNLTLSKPNISDNQQFDLTIDDLRLWHRAMSADAAKSLAMEDHRPFRRQLFANAMEWPWESDRSYILTTASYGFSEDLNAAVQAEFGPDAEVADWDDIKQAAGPWPALWAELLSLTDNAVHVVRDGQHLFSEGRSYQMERFYATMPDYYLAHSFVGSQNLVLGSWKNNVPLMAQAKGVIRYDQSVWTSSGATDRGSITRLSDGSWQHAGKSSAQSEAPTNRRIWLIDLSSTLPHGAGYKLQLGDKAAATLSKPNDGSWELGYQPSPEAENQRAKVTLTAKPKLWAVVQSAGRIYQTLVETTEDKAVCAELITLGSVPGLGTTAQWSLHAMPTNQQGTFRVADTVQQIRYITQHPKQL